MINTVKKISKSKFFVPAILLVLIFALFSIKFFAVDQAYWLLCISFCFIFICFLLPFDSCLGIFLFLLSFRAVYWSKYLRVSFYVFLAVFTIKYIIKVIKKEKKLMLVPLLITIALVLYSLRNYQYSEIATLLDSYALLACLYLTIANFNEISKTKLVKYFVAGILVSSLLASLIHFSPTMSSMINIGKQRFRALTIDTNYLQLECGFALACLLFMYLKNKINITRFAVLAFFLMGIGFLTKSKTFLIIFALLTLVFLVAQFFKDKKIFAFSLFIILLMTFIFMDEMIVIVDRFFISKHKNALDRIFTGRYSIWKEYISACTQSFSTVMFGYGVCAGPLRGGHAHNDYLQIWYKYGLVGILLIFVLIGTYLILIDKKAKQKWYNYIPLVTLMLMSFEETLLPYLGWMYILMAVLVIERFKVKDEKKIEKINHTTTEISNINISVVVPIYKVEKYLKRGIDCILNQTHKNLEVILVDDGSPDNSPKICDEYANMDKRIKVIHQKNSGVSAARNAGLKIATGDYIAFFDPDDVLDEKIYEKLLNSILENKTDVALCEMKHIYENSSKEISVDEINLKNITTKSIYPYLLKVGSKNMNGKIQTENIMGCVWRGLYSREIIKNIEFINLTVCEDLAFIIDVFSKNPKVSIVNEALYGYFQRETSAVHQFNEEKIKNRIKAYEVIISKIEKHVSTEELNAYKFHIYASIINELLKNCQKDKVESVKNLDFMKALNTKENYSLAMKSTKSYKYKMAYWFIYHNRLGVYSMLLKII